MSSALAIPTLRGERVRLEPLRLDHVDALVEAASEDRASYAFTRVPATRDEATSYVSELLGDWALGLVVPFVQIDARSDRVVGATRFMTIRRRGEESWPYAVEIGGTWLAASCQRTGHNTEAKWLLLEYAFSAWDVTRVDLRTDERNARSRAAIVRLGATFEGVLRHWQPSHVAGEESRYRNTAMFSVVDDEWPSVRARLASLLTR